MFKLFAIGYSVIGASLFGYALISHREDIIEIIDDEDIGTSGACLALTSAGMFFVALWPLAIGQKLLENKEES